MIEWTDKNNFNIQNGRTYTFKNLKTKRFDAIDLTLTSNNMNNMIENWQVNDELHMNCKYSDHFCLILEIEFNPMTEQIIDRFTWRFDCNKEHIFRKLVKKYMFDYNHFYLKYRKQKRMVHKIVNLFQLYIFKAANESFGIKRYNCNSFTRITKREKYLRQKRNRIKRKISKYKNRYSKNQIKKRKKRINQLKKTIRKLKENRLSEEANQIENKLNDSAIDNAKEFYKLYDKTTKTRNDKIGPLRDKDNNVTAKTKEEIAYELLNHFNKPLTENEYDKTHEQHHQKIINFMNNYQFNKNQPK